MGLIAMQEVTEPEFLSPIVRLYPPDSYPSPYDKKKKIYCIRLGPHDWMHKDGMTRRSSIAGLERPSRSRRSPTRPSCPGNQQR